MKKYKLDKTNDKGLTVVEIIMTIAILGILIAPTMSMFVFSAKISFEGSTEFKSAQLAQFYIEEIKAMDEFDDEMYVFNNETNCYERVVSENSNNYGAEISIAPNGIIYYITIDVISGGESINTIEASKIFK